MALPGLHQFPYHTTDSPRHSHLLTVYHRYSCSWRWRTKLVCFRLLNFRLRSTCLHHSQLHRSGPRSLHSLQRDARKWWIHHGTRWLYFLILFQLRIVIAVFTSLWNRICWPRISRQLRETTCRVTKPGFELCSCYFKQHKGLCQGSRKGYRWQSISNWDIRDMQGALCWGEMVMFSTNHFLIEGSILPREGVVYSTSEEIPVHVCLFLDKRVNPLPKKAICFFRPNRRGMSDIGHNIIPSDLLSRIRHLVVIVSNISPSEIEIRNWTGITFSELSQLIQQFKLLHSLRLDFLPMGRRWRTPDDKFIKSLQQLSKPIGAKRVELFTCFNLDDGSARSGKKIFTLSSEFHKHLKHSLSMKKGSEVMNFTGGEFFREWKRVSAWRRNLRWWRPADQDWE